MSIRQRHPLWVRVVHWLNVPLLALMIWSGILIYWANDVYAPFFPEGFYRLFSIDHRLAEGMGVHFTLAWLLVLNGILTLISLIKTRHWRDLVPRRSDGRDLVPSVLAEIGFRRFEPPLSGHGGYTPAQRLAYSGVLFLLSVEILSGFSIYKPVQLEALVSVLGGYDRARAIHFAGMILITLFIAVHVIQVVRAGWNTFRSMVAGFESNESLENQPHLKIVTRRAFVVWIGGWVAALGTWKWIRSRELAGGAPLPIRRVLEQNGRLWSALQSEDRLARIEGNRPEKGEGPRVNGMLGLEPPIVIPEWKLEVGPWEGDGSTFMEISDLMSMPRSRAETQFRCIEGWSMPLVYEGVRFADFLRFRGFGRRSGQRWTSGEIPADLYSYVALETPDRGYYVSIDMKSMLHPQTLLTWEMNGALISADHGAPLRLLIPIKYGIKSLKRVGRIWFSDTRPPDYWAERGYDWYAGL